MLFALYQGLLLIAWPFIALRRRWRTRREPAYGERVGERYGDIAWTDGRRPIWLHAVSAGEVLAAVPVVEWLLATYPGVPVLVTTTTPTGASEVLSRFGGRVTHCYAPYDFPWAVRRFFSVVHPHALVIMETELWPNLLAAAARLRIPVAVINARLSARSARRYRWIGGLTRQMLDNVALIACQSAMHRERFVLLGADTSRVSVTGNIKFDQSLDVAHRRTAAELSARWQLAERPVLLGASTHEGEDGQVLDAYAAVRSARSSACLVLVPRHPVRAAAILAMARRRGWNAALQSQLDGPAPDVVVGDVMGSLRALYGLADVAFIGGSLVPTGGHNPVEAAVWGVPIVMGPHVFNFEDTVARFTEHDALVIVTDGAALAATAADLLAHTAAARALGEKAFQAVSENTGALARTLELLTALPLLVTE
ncbi:MAG: lipid IV(A) 3-deoxy-D-manno-octulosonic acid transferase [Pseudomonadales bacterium]|nr:lipid IV(A) 3-deoxy-D-manno-octulosonic acid transferase [Pseudomonadales bacterium]